MIDRRSVRDGSPQTVPQSKEARPLHRYKHEMPPREHETVQSKHKWVSIVIISLSYAIMHYSYDGDDQTQTQLRLSASTSPAVLVSSRQRAPPNGYDTAHCPSLASPFRLRSVQGQQGSSL